MNPIDSDIIFRKLSTISNNLKLLQRFSSISEKEYVSDYYAKKAAERILQELIEAAVDINMHIISEKGAETPPDYYESFIKLGELRILPENLASKLAPSAGLRNILVHEYNAIKDSLVLKAIRKAQDDFAEYIKNIEAFLSG